MQQTVQVDRELLDRAVQNGGHHSDNEALNAALRQYVDAIARRASFAELVGTIDYHDGYPRRDRSIVTFDDDADPR